MDINAENLRLIVKDLPPWLQEPAITYAPAIARMSSAMVAKDFVAFLERVQSGDDSALAVVREIMTPEELALEKEKLAELTKIMAQESFEARSLARQVTQAVLRAALGVALAAVGL